MNRVNAVGERERVLPSPRLMSLNEAAKYLGVSYWHIRDLIDKGKLSKVQLGRRVLIDIRDLDKLIEESKELSY